MCVLRSATVSFILFHSLAQAWIVHCLWAGPGTGKCWDTATNIPSLPQEAHSLVWRDQNEASMCFPTVSILRYYTSGLSGICKCFLYSPEPPVELPPALRSHSAWPSARTRAKGLSLSPHQHRTAEKVKVLLYLPIPLFPIPFHPPYDTRAFQIH